MIELIPNVITPDLGIAIESMLVGNVRGEDILADTNNPELIALMHEARDQFCRSLGLRALRTITMLEVYRPNQFPRKAWHVHKDDRLVATLGLSTDPTHNAGTVVFDTEQGKIYGRYNANVFDLDTGKGSYRNAALLPEYASTMPYPLQAPRFGAALVPALKLHCAPYLPDGANRLLLLHSSK